jgi:hypothetical protein
LEQAELFRLLSYGNGTRMDIENIGSNRKPPPFQIRKFRKATEISISQWIC